MLAGLSAVDVVNGGGVPIEQRRVRSRRREGRAVRRSFELHRSLRVCSARAPRRPGSFRMCLLGPLCAAISPARNPSSQRTHHLRSRSSSPGSRWRWSSPEGDRSMANRQSTYRSMAAGRIGVSSRYCTIFWPSISRIRKTPSAFPTRGTRCMPSLLAGPLTSSLLGTSSAPFRDLSDAYVSRKRNTSS